MYHTQFDGSLMKTPMHLALNDLHTTWRGDNPNWVHNCKMAESAVSGDHPG